MLAKINFRVASEVVLVVSLTGSRLQHQSRRAVLPMPYKEACLEYVHKLSRPTQICLSILDSWTVGIAMPCRMTLLSDSSLEEEKVAIE